MPYPFEVAVPYGRRRRRIRIERRIAIEHIKHRVAGVRYIRKPHPIQNLPRRGDVSLSLKTQWLQSIDIRSEHYVVAVRARDISIRRLRQVRIRTRYQHWKIAL